ncbi:cell wall-active antibiotic response 4TMS protein YvqF [Kribbella voronezhensis]|uniref:Cell wall-active antibiotic response 4TMS protein YvqF n=1 Tax=Kribbella voronezhensis TaxID=2512212 RepID=A0A4R7TGP4_9ACTN|nr:DUF1707 domain-containing protein [Kribbella voronezhensis]TDU91451.1 cell wall-active antibiotic response 4TMS protein YvqF [Kribbella voronezhensis]
MAQDEVPQQNDSPRPQDAPRAPTGDELALRRRVSDLEREDVAEKLREAAGEGRLSYGELEERLETVYASKTYGELVQLTADLPNGLAVPAAATAPTTHYAPNVPATAPVMTVFLSEQKRLGAWLPAQRQEVNAVLGDVTLDYTEAQLPYDEIFIEVKSILADVKIRVPQNAIVHLDSNPILGSVAEQSATFAGADPTPGRPKVFHIHGTAILGEIKIKRGPRLSKRLGLN